MESNVLDGSTDNKSETDMVIDDNEKIELLGIVTNNCGKRNKYEGKDKRLQELGYIVNGGISTFRGHATLKTLAAISKPNSKDYQREKIDKHVEEIHFFLEEVKDEARFLPEIVLAVSEPQQIQFEKYSHSSLKTETQKGVIENIGYYKMLVSKDSLARVDGNHRLEAGKEFDYMVPFSIIIWDKNIWEDKVRLEQFDFKASTDTEAFIFYFLNSKAEKLQLEENYKGLVNSTSWSNEELEKVDYILPLVKHFDKFWLPNPLLIKDYLSNPLSQIGEILTDINNKEIDLVKFNEIIEKCSMIMNQVGKFEYIKSHFPHLYFQLIFYTIHNSLECEDPQRTLTRIDSWLSRYHYQPEAFSKAIRIYNICMRQLEKKHYNVFVAMPYYDEMTVKNYNTIFTEVCQKINAEGSESEISTFPIMTFKGKTFDIEKDIIGKIDACDIFVADITESNPNVMYELGKASNANKRIMILKKEGDPAKVPLDIVLKYNIHFNECMDLKEKIYENLKEIMVRDFDALFC